MLKRRIIFGAIATAVLLLGFIVSRLLWLGLYHRYDSPETGYYHGYVTMKLEEFAEHGYFLQIKAESDARWYWRYPSTFSYPGLSMQCERYEDNGLRTVKATINLRDWTYTSPDESGNFETNTLIRWLAGPNQLPVSLEHVDYIFKLLQDAANGNLPHTRHHGIRPEGPMTVHIQHFTLGPGIGVTEYTWFAIWVCLVFVYWRKTAVVRKGQLCQNTSTI